MTKVYIFNPQNDLALATGGINYVAPPFAVRMAADLAVLPAFIAEPGSLLITDSDLDAEWLEHLNTTFGLDVHAVKRSNLRHLMHCQVMPWGWCLDMRRRLLKWGVSSDSVPSKDSIYHLRGLSHRRVSILIHKRLAELMGRRLCPMPVELATPDEVMDFVHYYRNCYIKTPWSSSGRGIYHTIDGATPELEQWCRGSLRRQGSLLCEQALDKVMDFAVEFYCADGKAIERGFSIFSTDSHSQYTCGDVAPREVLKSRITALYPQLDEVIEALTQAINELVAPHYTGWMGMDMLLFKSATTPSKLERVGASSPSKIEGAGGSMKESNARSQSCCYTPQSLRDSSPTLGEQLTLHTVEPSSSPSKIDQWCKPNAECQACLTYAEVQPIDAERAAGGSMTESSASSHLSPLSLGLDPCVELNLRPTMGAITSMLGDSIIAQDVAASFAIEQRSSSGTPWPEHEAPVIENQRLTAGTLCLTPDSPTALYRAILTIQTL